MSILRAGHSSVNLKCFHISNISSCFAQIAYCPGHYWVDYSHVLSFAPNGYVLFGLVLDGKITFLMKID